MTGSLISDPPMWLLSRTIELASYVRAIGFTGRALELCREITEEWPADARCDYSKALLRVLDNLIVAGRVEPHPDPLPRLGAQLENLVSAIKPNRGEWPELLTPEEVVRFLRLGENGKCADPYQVVRRLNKDKGLALTKVQGRVFVALEELRAFVRRQTQLSGVL
ncbi:MAG: hypothetical protein AAGJ54_03795 [Planctomycetota bacterium]